MSVLSFIANETPLGAKASKDIRGLGLIELSVTAYPLGIVKRARVTTQGNLTYIGNRADAFTHTNQDPTLILSYEEGRAIQSALNRFFGDSAGVTPSPDQKLKSLETERDELARQNEAMRKGKKATETELKDIRLKYEALHEAARIIALMGAMEK